MFSDLIKISNLSVEDIENLVSNAMYFKEGLLAPDYSSKNLCLMFFENSTRTKISFDVAAKKLGLNVVNFETTTSSINKGETLKDTLENLYFIGCEIVVIRTSEDELISNLKNIVSYPIKFINAGSGKNAHPTQALLDYMTMKENLGAIKGKKVVIVGDIEHSRVAKSNIALLNKMGAKIVICAPEYFKPQKIADAVSYTADLKEALWGADVVMGLRIQKERILEAFDLEDYIHNYQISSSLLDTYAPNALVMHPGPVNRDVEFTSELIDSTRGKTILEQARNGVFIRMAVIQQLLKENV